MLIEKVNISFINIIIIINLNFNDEVRGINNIVGQQQGHAKIVLIKKAMIV